MSELKTIPRYIIINHGLVRNELSPARDWDTDDDSNSCVVCKHEDVEWLEDELEGESCDAEFHREREEQLHAQLATVTAERDAARGFAKL